MTRVYIRQYQHRLALEVYVDGQLDYERSMLEATDEDIDSFIHNHSCDYIRDERVNTETIKRD